MSFVLDCSVTMAWCFADESDAYSDAVLDGLAEREAVVPALWPLEVGNVVIGAARRKRLTVAHASHFLDLLAALPITVDKDTPDHALGRTLSLAREHGLSLYDATYLELAMRTGLPLATRDATLIRAAQRSGARVLGRRDLSHDPGLPRE